MFLAQRSLRDCLLRVMEDDFDWPHGIKDTIREVTSDHTTLVRSLDSSIWQNQWL